MFGFLQTFVLHSSAGCFGSALHGVSVHRVVTDSDSTCLLAWIRFFNFLLSDIFSSMMMYVQTGMHLTIQELIEVACRCLDLACMRRSGSAMSYSAKQHKALWSLLVVVSIQGRGS
eukprot:TRINITY_DN18887_c0_g1_i3.p1 TRINITY_DN18887_c0_g1~~TRINITY_DN18887_c0_g1_i3.p1  ORF type:complete len:116 (-),score=13.33 TRINITY_DN18887_c0_g1_i3:48-395(-)